MLRQFVEAVTSQGGRPGGRDRVQEDLARVRTELSALTWSSGKRTAGAAARGVKENLQADGSDPKVQALERFVADALRRHPMFEIAARPARITRLMFSRYEPGMTYGAHTDDALRNLLETARSLAGRRLITVFGAGGDRDRTKRPLMGMVAARLSDVVVITSDNPRGEDPQRIIDEVKRGADAETRQSGKDVLTIVDRHDAILQAIDGAAKGDVVLIAGKGHEKYQEIAGRTLPFDDVAVAREGLEARRVKSRAG